MITRIMLRIVLAVLCFIPTCGAHAGWFGYDSYDDCVIGRMKGKDTSVYLNVLRVCRRQFKIETPVNPSLVKWERRETEDNMVYIYVDPYSLPEGYEKISSGKFIFSKKLCSEASSADFDPPEIIKFDDSGYGLATVLPWQAWCVRALDFRGVEK